MPPSEVSYDLAQKLRRFLKIYTNELKKMTVAPTSNKMGRGQKDDDDTNK